MDQQGFEELAGEVTVERSVVLPADVETIWAHLTDGDLLGEWMEGEIQLDPRRGGSIEMAPARGEKVWGTIEEVIEGRRLQWSWRTDRGMPTLVEIELEPVDDGTGLTVRETLLPWRVTGQPPQWMEPPEARARVSLAA